MERIAVSGANGEFGRGVVEQLLRHTAPTRVIATVRDPARATELVDRGVVVRPGDFDDGETLASSFAGATTVLVNATFFGVAPELRGKRIATAIRAARRAGAARVVVTSWPEADECPLDLTRDFIEVEELTRTCGPEWTILRLGYGIADSIARDVIWALRSGELTAPAADARCTPAAVPDLVEAAARTLLEPHHAGRVYELTGPRAIGWADLAGLASAIGGRRIEYRPVDELEFRAQLDELGVSAAAATGLIEYYAAIRGGWGNRAHDDLAGVLGRPATDSLDAVRQRIPSDARVVPLLEG